MSPGSFPIYKVRKLYVLERGENMTKIQDDFSAESRY